jgi:hypothetical protein
LGRINLGRLRHREKMKSFFIGFSQKPAGGNGIDKKQEA